MNEGGIRIEQKLLAIMEHDYAWDGEPVHAKRVSVTSTFWTKNVTYVSNASSRLTGIISHGVAIVMTVHKPRCPQWPEHACNDFRKSTCFESIRLITNKERTRSRRSGS